MVNEWPKLNSPSGRMIYFTAAKPDLKVEEQTAIILPLNCWAVWVMNMYFSVFTMELPRSRINFPADLKKSSLMYKFTVLLHLPRVPALV